ncbi:MAG: ComEA family DNA-binding protein [Thermodesulfobacteriota bacterium]
MKKLSLCSLLLLALVFAAGTVLAQDEDGKLNLNAATQEQLVQIPGIKPELATRIIEKRKADGEFVDMDELLDVEGVDADLLRQLKERVYVKPAANCNC